MLIDRYMPSFDVIERHSIYIDAPPGIVFSVVEGLRPADVPSFTLLMGIRSLPARLSRSFELPQDRSEPMLEQMGEAGFKTLFRHEPTEIVIGVIGRFWHLRPKGMREFEDADDFIQFSEPGYAKATMNFHVWPEGGGSMLSTETRVQATDASARKRFKLYWRVIYPGSALIRRSMLRAARDRAEEVATKS